MLFINRINSCLSDVPLPLPLFKRDRWQSHVIPLWEKVAPKISNLFAELVRECDRGNDYFARMHTLEKIKKQLLIPMSTVNNDAEARELLASINSIEKEMRKEKDKRAKILTFSDGIITIFKKIYPDIKRKADDLEFLYKLYDKRFCFSDFNVDLYYRLDSIPYDPYFITKEAVDTGDAAIPAGNVRLLEIENEIESSSKETKEIFQFFHLYFSYFSNLIKKDEKLDIINYLEGNATLEDLRITKENAIDYLQLAKIIDLAQKRHFLKYRERTPFIKSTYKIRLRILELLSPNLKTIEAFTYTIDANKLKNADFTKNQANWLPERVNFYAKRVIPYEYINMRALSKLMNCEPPVIYALRGTSCAGKTTFVKSILGIAPNDDSEEVRGVMTHDSVKNILKAGTCAISLTNDQVHDEAARGPLKLYKQEIIQNSKESLILDYRMTSIEELEEAIDAARNGRVVRIIELDASLTTLYQRMLTRDPFGKSPCQQPMVIKQGLLDIRQSRRAIIERILHEPLIQSYELHYTHKSCMLKIARKVGSILQISNEDLFEECCKIPTATDMDADSQIVINSHYPPFERVEIQVRDYQNIHTWAGFTLEQAVRFKGLAMSPAEAKVKIKAENERIARFGRVWVEPFSESWLSDYPEVLKHVKSEHILHNRNDIGLWPTTKFSSSMNKNYSPEASIQMKLGYFEISNNNVQVYEAMIKASPGVMSEINVSRAYRYDRYRLFVHPEAYDHFQALHDAGIPFVTPEKSEFIGTPTSSYRSWVVRRIHDRKDSHWPTEKKSVPFIVKFGVGSGSNPSKLLSSSEIARSIEAQNKLKDNPHLWLFPERFAISLKDIPDYPPPTNSGAVESISSGMIIREFPQEMLEGKYSIVSFQSIQSMERTRVENKGICRLAGSREGTEGLPLIFELIDIAMQKKEVNTPAEFIEKFLIQAIFKAFDKPMFKEELSLSLHAQNLCLVLDRENIPVGFAYRDLGDVYSIGDVNHIKRFTGSFTVSWKYYDLMKILNIISASDNEFLPPIPGTPVEVGCSAPLLQKSMNFYLRHQCESSVNNAPSQKILSELSITLDEYLHLLRLMDDAYMTKLNTYYEIDVRTILSADGTLPAAEINSAQENIIFRMNQMVLNSRRKQPLYEQPPIACSSCSLQ